MGIEGPAGPAGRQEEFLPSAGGIPRPFSASRFLLSAGKKARIDFDSGGWNCGIHKSIQCISSNGCVCVLLLFLLFFVGGGGPVCVGVMGNRKGNQPFVGSSSQKMHRIMWACRRPTECKQDQAFDFAAFASSPTMAFAQNRRSGENKECTREVHSSFTSFIQTASCHNQRAQPLAPAGAPDIWPYIPLPELTGSVWPRSSSREARIRVPCFL